MPDTFLSLCFSLVLLNSMLFGWGGGQATAKRQAPARLLRFPASASLCSTLSQKAAGCCGCPGNYATRPPDTMCT